MGFVVAAAKVFLFCSDVAPRSPLHHSQQADALLRFLYYVWLFLRATLESSSIALHMIWLAALSAK